MSSWKDAFYFSRSERLGIAFLLFLIIVIALAPGIIEKLTLEPEPLDISKYESEITKFKAEQDSLDKVKKPSYQIKNKTWRKGENEPREINDFKKSTEVVLDINSASAEDFRQLNGIGEVLSARIVKYRDAMGGFKSIDQVANVYGLEADVFKAIKPQLVLKKVPAEKSAKQKIPEKPAAKEPRPITTIQVDVQINSASAEEFSKLKGIGGKLSARIVKFREALGGFHSIEQISTVYGIEPEVFEHIKPQLLLDERPLKKLNPQTASKEELAAHPYISSKFADQIINYRTKIGPITSEEDFRKLYFVNDELLAKLKPYLTYSP